MRTWTRMVVLLVVLGFGLPSYGEILVYKFTQNGTFYSEEGGRWEVEKEVGKAYLVLDVNYVDFTITQAELISYGRDEIGRWFTQDPVDLELIRVTEDSRVRWILSAKEAEDGEVTNFASLAGLARNRNVGTGVNQEVASSLKGYSLEDVADTLGRFIGISTISATLFPAWTYWANGSDADEGNQDFDDARQFVKDFLTERGYEELSPL